MHPAMSMKGGITIPYHAIRGNVKFDNVSFTYPTRPNQVSYTTIVFNNYNM